ncbi:Tyrosine-protein kinase abl1 [Balamuthia mandrillaris]
MYQHLLAVVLFVLLGWNAPYVVHGEDLEWNQLVTGSFVKPFIAVYRASADEAWFLGESQITSPLVFDFATKSTRRVTTTGTIPTSSLNHFSGGIIGNKLYLLSGRQGSTTSKPQLYVLDTDTLVWSQLANLAWHRAGHVVLILEEEKKLYAYAGWVPIGNLYYADLWEYSIDTNSWTDRGDYGSPLKQSGGATLGQFLFFHAGELSTGTKSNQFIRFNGGDNKWSALSPSAPAPLLARSNHGMFSDGSSLSIWIVGGSTNDVHYRARFGAVEDVEPEIDSFGGSSSCSANLMVHKPSGKVICGDTNGIWEITRKCNYASGCPLIVSPSCPSAYPFRCASQMCVSDANECRGLRTDCASDDITCVNGDCASSCEECTINAVPCLSGEVMCCDGSCRSSYDLCPSAICTSDLPFRCEDGSCKAAPAECAASPCGGGRIACGDGQCAEESECERLFCPVSTFLCPSDLSCASQEEGCARVQSYCGAGKVVCWDGTCVTSTVMCPTPWLLEKIAPITAQLYPSIDTIELPIVAWNTDATLGRITIDITVIPDASVIHLKEATLALVNQATLSVNEEDGEIFGPCVELYIDSDALPSVEFIRLEFLVEPASNLRQNQFRVAHLNEEAMEWTLLPTETSKTEDTSQVKISASVAVDGTFCVAYVGDKRPFLSLLAPAVYTIHGSSDLQVYFSLSSPVWDKVTVPFSITGTAREGTDYRLFTESRSPAIFEAGSSSAQIILFFPGSSSFSGYRTLEFHFSEASSYPSQIDLPDDTSTTTTILLVNYFQSISANDLLVVFPGSSLALHQLTPVGTNRKELSEYQLEITIQGIVEKDENGTELVFHSFSLEQRFAPHLLGEGENEALRLSGSYGLPSAQNLSMEATFRINKAQLYDLSSQNMTTAIERNGVYLELMMSTWEFDPATVSLELVMKLSSNDGPLVSFNQGEDGSFLDENSSSELLEARRTSFIFDNNNRSSFVTTFRTEESWLWLETILSSPHRAVQEEDGKPLVYVGLPFSNNASMLEYRSIVVLQTFSASPSSSSVSDDLTNEDEEAATANLLVIVLPSALSSLLLCLITFGFVFFRKYRRRKETKKDIETSMEMLEASEYVPAYVFNIYNNKKNLKKKEDDDDARSSFSNGSLSVGEMFALNFEELEFGKQIGKGSFGVVFKGKWRLTPVAIKLLNNSLRQEQLQEFRKEVELMQNLRPHSNVVLLLGVCLHHPEHPLCIVTELLPNGSLLDFLKKQKSQLPEEEKLGWNELMVRIAKGVAAGMQHLHAEQIIHCDLSARNILLTENLEAKVADFGMSRVLSAEEDHHQTMSNIGPVRWMAPESLKDRVYSEKTDAWSFGVVLWEIATFGEMPYKNLTTMQVTVEVVMGRIRLEAPEGTPEVFCELMEQCLASNPEERPTFENIHCRLQKAHKSLKASSQK